MREELLLHARHIAPSSYKDVLAAGRGEPWGKMAKTYAGEIIARSLTDWEEDVRTPALDFGNLHEPDAIMGYELLTFRKVQHPCDMMELLEMPNWGLETFTEAEPLDRWPRIGGYPDGLVGSDGMLEVKCRFNPTVHINTCITGKVPQENLPQIHGYLLITGREWCDYVSYCPWFEGKERLKVIRVYPDLDFHKQLLGRLIDFQALVRSMAERFIKGEYAGVLLQ